jgi:hypothetical protein
MTLKHPIQPLAPDEHGTLRFKANKIVQHLLDSHPSCGLNELARMDFSDDDRRQFAQLIGYSLDGYGSLRSYVDDLAYAAAENMSRGMDRRDATIAALEGNLSELRAAIDELRQPVAKLFEMHPDDLAAD